MIKIKGKIKHPFLEFDVDLEIIEGSPAPTPTPTPIPTPEPGPTPTPEPMPNVVKTANPSNIVQTIAGLVAGDMMVLEDGTYPGVVVQGKFATKDKPIIIKAKNPHQAIFKSGGIGFHVYNCTYITLEDMVCQDCGIGFYMGSPEATSGKTENIIFRNLKSFNSDTWGMAANGNAKCKSKTLRFESCVIKTVTGKTEPDNGHGLKLAGWEQAQHSEDVTIINCDISEAWYHGIQCSTGWNNVQVTNNTLYNNGLKGDYRAGVRIGNEVGGVIRGNIIKNNRRNILIQAGATNILIEKNQLSGAYGGVVVTDGRDVIIRDNTFEDHAKEGIYLRGSQRITIERNKFTGTGNVLIKSDDEPNNTEVVVRENVNLVG